MGLLSHLRSLMAAPAAAPAPSRAELDRWASKTVERLRSSLTSGRLRLLPYLDNGQDETEEIRNEYPKMLREAVIKSGFLTKTLSVASQDVQITAVHRDNPREQEAAEFVRHALQRLKGGTLGLAWSVLSGMLIRGWSVAEKTFQVESEGRWAGKWLWKTIKSKSNVLLDVDEFRNVRGVASKLEPGRTWDPNGFVVASYLGLDSNPFGMSDFRAAYRPYWLKDTAWRLRGVFLEKYSAGPMLKGVYSSADQQAALESALEDAKASTWVSVPVGALVDSIDLGTRGTADFKEAILDCDREMLISIVGAYLQILEGQIANGRGDTGVHRETSELFQWLLAALLTQILNEQLIPELIEVNFAGVTPPHASLGAINDAALAASLAVDRGLQQMGFKLSRKKVADFYGREEATEADDVLTAPQPAGPPGGGLPFADQGATDRAAAADLGDTGRPFVPSWESGP